MEKARTRDLFAINAYWFGLSVMWNSLHIIILPAVLLHFVPEGQKNTYLGLLTFLGLVIAMIVQPLSGWWSDRHGRRWPLMSLGTVLDVIFLVLLGWAGGLVWLAVGYLGLQLTSNLAHGPAQGLIPDRVPREQHGAASGIKNLMDMSGLVVASLVMGNLLDPAASRPWIPLLVLIGVLLASALVTIPWVRNRPRQPINPPKEDGKSPSLLRMLRSQPGYSRLIAARYAFLLGVYAIQVFAQYFIRDVIAPPNPIKLTGDLMATITLPLIAFAVAGGWLGDKLGHRRMLYAACGFAIAGSLAMTTARSPSTVLAFGALMGMGIGLFLTSNWALLNRLAPAAQAGAYLGLTNLATAGSAATGRLLGPLIDGLNNAYPGTHAGYTAMFVFGALCAAFCALLIGGVKPAR